MSDGPGQRRTNPRSDLAGGIKKKGSKASAFLRHMRDGEYPRRGKAERLVQERPGKEHVERRICGMGIADENNYSESCARLK